MIARDNWKEWCFLGCCSPEWCRCWPRCWCRSPPPPPSSCPSIRWGRWGARIAGLLFGELLEEQVESELLSGRKYWRNKTEIIEQLLIRGEGGSRADRGAEVLKSFMGNSQSNQQTGFFLDSSAHCTVWYCHMDPRPISLKEGLVFCKFTKQQTENRWWFCLSECLFTGAIELLREPFKNVLADFFR